MAYNGTQVRIVIKFLAMEKIDIKYRKPLVGRYNKSVSRCLDCDHEFLKNPKYGTIFDNINGFNDSHIGMVAMWECPVCFSKWFYHSEYHYDYFLDAVDDGTQKYYGSGAKAI